MKTQELGRPVRPVAREAFYHRSFQDTKGQAHMSKGRVTVGTEEYHLISHKGNDVAVRKNSAGELIVPGNGDNKAKKLAARLGRAWTQAKNQGKSVADALKAIIDEQVPVADLFADTTPEAMRETASSLA